LKGHTDAVEQKLTPPEPTFDIPAHLRKHFELVEKNLAEARKRDQQIATQNPQPVEKPIGIPDDVLKLFNDKPAPAIPPPAPPPQVERIPQGAIVGHLIAHFNYRDPDTGQIKQAQAIHPGDSVILTTVNSGETLKPVYDTFVVVDYFKSGMSEYDANSVFVPLEHLQTLRGMENRASNILIKLKNYADADGVVKALAKMFEHERLGISTWEQKQGPLLKAIEIEKNILNILLFMIIAVAGFGILAIFSMIVAEKTRDIGILKALGASRAGVMQIFLTYGLLLGAVGAGLGTILGLTVTHNINAIEAGIAAIKGSRVFSPETYYFNEIPTDVNATAVLIVNLGAIAIATVFSILPAFKAAMLHPVQALRYE
jgi:lipoprotein-releasing system permease protein